MEKEWKAEAPRFGDFEGARAIYIVRGGSLNYPVPVAVHVGARVINDPPQELNFEFCIPEYIHNVIWRDQLDGYSVFSGCEWFGPVAYPE